MNKLVIMICVCLFMTVPASVGMTESAGRFEKRCGWFDNPTPGNVWLHDKDGEWIIGEQGRYQIKEDWDWPAFKPGQWVKTNRNYGYGCVCINAQVDQKTHRVLQIKSIRVRPLAACRQEPALKKWEESIK